MRALWGINMTVLQETFLNRPYFLATLLLLSSAAVAQPAPTLTIDLAQPKAKVSPQLYGLMTEEINYSYDGGLYAELVRNRTFQDRRQSSPKLVSLRRGQCRSIDGHRSHHRPERSPAAEPAIDGTRARARTIRRASATWDTGAFPSDRKPPITVRSMPRRTIRPSGR